MSMGVFWLLLISPPLNVVPVTIPPGERTEYLYDYDDVYDSSNNLIVPDAIIAPVDIDATPKSPPPTVAPVEEIQPETLPPTTTTVSTEAVIKQAAEVIIKATTQKIASTLMPTVANEAVLDTVLKDDSDS